ncbi:Tetratricopeptide repeat protein 1 [Dichotomopilus funicola]|uniref:Tetratricopeptide repeat protein 1 n=1 Tax=Dichotomopilus funicola TaxID=1934379 RepID=A0AAN6ZP65_9PEZI|nr:Tetratricopeptide repeat protein 1 [Dichotomopilus funicola]
MASNQDKAPAEAGVGAQNGPGPKRDAQDDGVEKDAVQERFDPEEEASMLAESNAHKAEANTLFTSGKYDTALNKYDEAVAVCPNYLDYELAVLWSNVAACHLKLEEWKEAVSSATSALDGLDRLEKQGKEAEDKEKAEAERRRIEEADDVEEEIVSAGATKAGPALSTTTEDELAAAARQKRQDDIARIRAKALMRRARARSELGGWSNLEGAVEDYKRLSTMANLTATDKKIVQAQLRMLPPLAKAAQEKETAEMWSKLKDLGNGLLKPFGLSTDNFQMVKDETTGGYSMNFQNGGGK